MMKAIFLCEKESTLRSVYSVEVTERLKSTAGICDKVFCKKDVLEALENFAQTEYVFSTWGMPSFTKEEIKTLFPSLKCVFYAAGTVQKFARPFIECGVSIFSAWAANAVPVSEYTLSQILLSNKGFFAHAREMKARNLALCREMKEKYPGNYSERVGLIGVGMIGSMVAKRLREYDLRVCAYDPFLSDERARALGVERCSLEEVFSSCRVVSNHLADNEQTRGMLDYSLFSRMMPYSTFINTGRGAQVVEEDLVRVLSEREDITALLDVTYPEPSPEGHPFYALPNCILTPHIAGSLARETHRMAEYMIEEFHRYQSSEPTLYRVSEEMLATMA